MIQRPVIYKHQGKVDEKRVVSVLSPQSITFRHELVPGAVLADELVMACQRRGVNSAAISLVDGYFEGFEYCLASQNPDRKNKITYMPPIKETGIAMLITANATVGIGEDGEPLVHCHGLVTSNAGVPVGGHIFANKIKICRQPVMAFFTGFTGIGFTQQYDFEVTQAIFKPVRY
ncbi:hypothetical protein MNBD_ALPHA08-224 [hydrothermal vent metagenome]|uniref:PPC domain-containing protein n=1 Tax=hydrothermal vent metagenome TaxID=652676 RepID=A0A3B0SPJ6_9ZZZZ